MKRFIPLLFLCIIIAAMLACGNSDVNTGKAVENKDTSSAAKADAGKSEPTKAPPRHFKPGERVNVGDTWEVTVLSAKTGPGGEYDTPKSGNTYLFVEVSLKNIAKEEKQLFGNVDWTLKDLAGQKYDNAYISAGSNPPEGKVEAGGPAKGTIVYEVPAGTKAYTLAFEVSMWDKGQTIWDIAV